MIKKGWIITLIVLGFLFSVQQIVRSQKETRKSIRITITPSPSLTPIPTQIPTSTPTPSPTTGIETVISMTSSVAPASSPSQTTSSNTNTTNTTTGTTGTTGTNSTTNNNNAVSTTNTGGGATGGTVINTNAQSLQDQFQNLIQNIFGSISPAPVNKSVPSPTPELVHHFNVIDYYLQPLQPSSTPPPPQPTAPLSPDTSAPANTPIPTTQLPPILSPTSDLNVANNNSSPTTQNKEEKNKIKVIVDNKKVGGITIVPEAFAAESGQDNKPLLPQEQKNDTPTSGGILVTLEQKTGGSFVTRQDELTVKRGDQSFTISNQSGQVTPQLEINANNVIARSNMGLSVDPLSGILTVETPTGPQKMSIMPDEALGIVIELKALNAKSDTEPSILLVSENGSLIYRISGERVEKFLGLFPISIQKQILVAADTGSVIKVELPPLSQFLSFFTF